MRKDDLISKQEIFFGPSIHCILFRIQLRASTCPVFSLTNCVKFVSSRLCTPKRKNTILDRYRAGRDILYGFVNVYPPLLPWVKVKVDDAEFALQD